MAAPNPPRLHPKRLTGPAACLLAASALAAGPARAQEGALTLPRAIAMAEDAHESPAIARERVVAARAARRGAYASILPTVSGSFTYRRRKREVVRSVGGEDITLQRQDSLSAGLNGSLSLFSAPRYARIRAATHGLEAAEHEADDVQRDLQLEAAEAFFAVLSAEKVYEAAVERLRVAELTSEQARRRLNAGLAGKNVVTRAELETATARLEVTTAENAVKNTRLSLAFLLGLDEVVRPLAAPEGPVLGSWPEAELAREALALRPDARALTARIRQAKALEREPWLRLVPELGASGNYSWVNETGFSGRNTDWTIAVTATWVAYDGGLRYANASETAANRRALELELSTLKRRLSLELRTALTDLATSTAAVEQAEVRAHVAEANEEEVRARFEAGLATALELADAVEQSFDGRAEVARQEFARRLSELGVLRAAGRWPGKGRS